MYEFADWLADVQNAGNLGADVFFSRCGRKYFDSNSVIFFYSAENRYSSLEEAVFADRFDFTSRYPGITVTAYDIGRVDFSCVPAGGKDLSKKYIAVLYDFSRVRVSHDDMYHLVIFFNFRPTDRRFCVLEIDSVDDELFKYIDEFKSIFAGISETAGKRER